MTNRIIPTIFISYSWSDSDVVDQIEIAFQQAGISVLRDIREIEYKGSIKEYMTKVREVDFVILIISYAFLKSPNAMFEVTQGVLIAHSPSSSITANVSAIYAESTLLSLCFVG